MSWTDAIGIKHEPVGNSAVRIVCLVPSITELICDLGLAQYLVGRTGFCIHPREVVQHISKVGGTKDVNVDKIHRLNPTHLLVNIDENEKTCVEQLAQFIPNIIVTHPQTPQDNLALFALLGNIFDVPERAQQLANQFLAAQYELQISLPQPLIRQRVLYCIWKDPWMTVSESTYIAAMLAQIGWDVVDLGSSARYPAFDWSDSLVDAVDLVLLSSEPYQFNGQHVEALTLRYGKPVLLVDGEMISWYGSRAIAGLNYLRGVLNSAR